MRSKTGIIALLALMACCLFSISAFAGSGGGISGGGGPNHGGRTQTHPVSLSPNKITRLLAYKTTSFSGLKKSSGEAAS